MERKWCIHILIKSAQRRTQIYKEAVAIFLGFGLFVPEIHSKLCKHITTTNGSYSVIFFKKKKIQWTAAQEISFQNLKKAVTASPILKLLNLSQVFILQTNASDRGFGAFLLQKDLDKNNQPITYISRKLNKAE